MNVVKMFDHAKEEKNKRVIEEHRIMIDAK
jgi:hypothetical protein